MSEMGEMWRDLKKLRQEKRADNRENSAGWLTREGIPFESRSDGAHLIVTPPHGPLIDFWPGTGKWIVRGAKKHHRGVASLVRRCTMKEQA